jgi:non-specific serine/threonine protein kinase
VGINLTAADYVIHFDPWWNPAVENQATDRAHRIGQVNPVFVYRMITRDTIEEKIHNMQQKKKELADSVITDEASWLKRLSLSDIENLFDIPV